MVSVDIAWVDATRRTEDLKWSECCIVTIC